MLFDEATFGGNGRTCATCHMKESGTITLEAVQARHTADPNDPLFRHDGLDNGAGGTSRITTHATIRVELELPPHVSIAGNPSQRTIVVFRGVPATRDAPALDGLALMFDLRHSDLEEQALGAIEGHAQSTVAPTGQQLNFIANTQRWLRRFFSSDELHSFATANGPVPQLPAALTASEARGRQFFTVAPLTAGKEGACGVCHSGAMLNEVNALVPPAFGIRPGGKFGNVLVAEANRNQNPRFTFLVDNGSGDVRSVTLADPGLLLTGLDSPHFAAFLQQPGQHPVAFAGSFKTPTLWGIRHTAPYFHDNSAKTLREVVDHYADVFFPPLGIHLTLQDREDIVTFMMRL